jgi:succinyl-CoA synthetase beta subunit
VIDFLQCATLLAQRRAQRSVAMTEPEAKQFLGALNIPTPRAMLVSKPLDAFDAARDIGTPVAIKVVSREILHKTEAGGIICPVTTPEAAVEACDLIRKNVETRRPDAVIEGFLIEQYRSALLEWILSLKNDAQFGPFIMFGLGGIYVEVFKQTTFRLAPLRASDVDEFIAELPAARLLEGARGKPPLDRYALGQAIKSLSALAAVPELISQICEIEINPLTVENNGICALDAVITLNSLES